MKRILICLVLLTSLLPPTHGSGYSSDKSDRAKPFVDGMLNMMDRMGFIDLDEYPDRFESEWSTPSWYTFDGYSPSPYPPAAAPWMRAPPMPQQRRAPKSPLDGIWQGRSGEILLIRDGHFRIYVTRDHYRAGKLRIRGKALYMHDPRTDITKKYEYATQKGRLVLRDPQGRLLLYRRPKER